MVKTASLLATDLAWSTVSSCDDAEDVTYLNYASQMPMHPAVQNAGNEAIRCPPWKQRSHQDQATVRELFASLIHADSTNIAIMPSTAFAMTLAAVNIQRLLKQQEQRRHVLLLQDQMCSAVYPWQRLCEEEENLSLRVVPYPMEGNWTEAVLERIDGSVLVACLPPVHWSDGSIIDLQQISAKCRLHEICLVVDGTQAAGIMDLDVSRIRPALLAASVHKWLRGPIGASLVYVSPDIYDLWDPLDQHGRSRQVVVDHPSSWDSKQNEIGPKGYPSEYVKDARKFDSGGKPNPILLSMICSGLQLVLETRIADVQEHLKELTNPIINWAEKNGFTMTTDSHAHHIIGIRPGKSNPITPQDMIRIAGNLEKDGIYIAVRCGAFRISPFVDTTHRDIHRLLEGLDKYCS